MNLLKKNWEIFEQKEFYNYPKRNPFMIILGMGVLVAIFFACQTILPIVMHAIDKNADTSENTTMILLGIGNFLAAVVLWLFFMRREKKYCPKVVRKMTIIQCISGVFFGLAFSGVIGVIVDTIKYCTGLIQTDASVDKLMSAGLLLQIVVSVVSAGLAEEILLRGCIQNRLMGRINNIWAVIITAALFGLIHGNVSQFITATVSGFAFGFVYAKTRSLWAAILAHMANNFAASIQADFFKSNPGEGTFWIFNAVLIVVSIVLAIPFFKADAAVIEKSEA